MQYQQAPPPEEKKDRGCLTAWYANLTFEKEKEERTDRIV